jgi:hypothetical protein
VTYWPQRGGYRAWAALDRGAVREELAQIAALGCDTVRLCLRWEEFQPRPDRVGSPALRALEQALDIAQSNGLRVALALFAGAMGGAIQLPAWTTGIPLPHEDDDPQLAARFGPRLLPAEPTTSVLYNDIYHTTPVRDLYADRAQLEAQRYGVREIVGYFAQHPAAWAWQLGYEWERAYLPRSAAEGRDWLAALAEHARAQGAKGILGAASPRSLVRRQSIRPDQLADVSDVLAVHTYPAEPLRPARPASPALPAFLHALTAALCEKPVLVASLGLPTAPDNQARYVADRAFGRVTRSYLADEEAQASFVEGALAQLYRDGATGVWLAAFADPPADEWRLPPFDRCQRERTVGVVRPDGSEKPAAAAVRTFADRLRAGSLGTQGRPPTLDTDPERYWRDPQSELARLLREWEGE